MTAQLRYFLPHLSGRFIYSTTPDLLAGSARHNALIQIHTDLLRPDGFAIKTRVGVALCRKQ